MISYFKVFYYFIFVDKLEQKTTQSAKLWSNMYEQLIKHIYYLLWWHVITSYYNLLYDIINYMIMSSEDPIKPPEQVFDLVEDKTDIDDSNNRISSLELR